MDKSQTAPDLSTPEGMQAAMKIIRNEEFNRFCELMRQLLNQIQTSSVNEAMFKEKMANALATMELINAE